jgi:DNA processing protein
VTARESTGACRVLAREKPQVVALLHLPGVTTRRLRDALARFGSPAGAWEAIAAGGAPHSMAEWTEAASHIEPVELMRRLEAEGTGVVLLGEHAYPESLAEIHDPPYALFFRGTLPGTRPCVSIVGARKATTYGLEAAHCLAEGLALEGVCVVSGAAYGIDSAAHAGALAAGGHTCAVLGCGVDVVYPRRNSALFTRIVASGCIVSEYVPGTEPRNYQFPARNRIIAGMAAATIVVEASERSGALLTADFALAEDREVFAVPGQIFSSNSTGTHGLLRAGAAVATRAEDVLSELGIEPRLYAAGDHAASGPGTAAGEKELLDALDGGPCDVEELCARAAMSAAAAGAALSSLEIRGLVKRGAGGRFQKCRPRKA